MFKNKLPNNLLKAYIFILITTIIWAAAGPIIKYTLNYIPPLTFLFLRFLIACVILLPYTVYEIQKVKINKKDYLNFFLLGLFSQTSIALIFVALKYTTAIDNAVIGILGAILSVAAGRYFYHDKVNKGIKKGVILASIGTIVVVLEPLITGNGYTTRILHRLMGNSLLLLYNVVWVVFIVWSKMSMGEPSKLLKKSLSFVHLKPMTKNYPPTLITSISLFVGLITIMPLALIEMSNGWGFNLLDIGVNGLIGLMYMALFSSLVGYILYQKAIEHVKTSDIAFFHYLSPLFTLPVAFILLGEVPTKFVLIGSILIASGVYIGEINNNGK